MNSNPNRHEQSILNCELLEERQMLSTVDVFAAGVTNQETIELKIDDAVVQTWTNLGGDAYSAEYVQLRYTTAQNVDPGQIKIEFTNDFFNDATNTDYNVRIDKIVVDGVTIETESSDVFSTGTWLPADDIVPGFRQSEFLHANGYFQYPAQNTTGSAIQMRVRGDVGNEQFNLLINGQSVGTYTATTNWTSISYNHTDTVLVTMFGLSLSTINGIQSQVSIQISLSTTSRLTDRYSRQKTHRFIQLVLGPMLTKSRLGSDEAKRFTWMVIFSTLAAILVVTMVRKF